MSERQAPAQKKDKNNDDDLPPSLKVLLLIVVLGLVGYFWWSLRNSYSTLETKITSNTGLAGQIDNLSKGSVNKAELNKKIDELQRQIDATIPKTFPNQKINTQKEKIDKQILDLKTDINQFVQPITLKDELALRKDQLALEKDLLNTSNAINGSLVQTIGGLFFLLTGYFTWRNLRVAEQNLRVSEEKQITERFSTAVKSLAEGKLAVRLGGIYALERIAQESEKDCWPIMQVLTGFVRERCGEENTNIEKRIDQEIVANIPNQIDIQEVWLRYQASPPTDIREVLKILEKRSTYHTQPEPNPLDLSGADFRWMKLDNISFAKMDLRDANFSGADLINTDLNETNLSGAEFRFAALLLKKLNSVTFVEPSPIPNKSKKAILDNADLSFAELQGVNLSSINLSGANLSGVNLLEANLSGANLLEANLSGAIFAEIDATTNQPIKITNLAGAIFTRANFSGVNLSKRTLSKLKFSEVNFSGANLSETNFSEADLSGAIFTEIDPRTNQPNIANLAGAIFIGANLVGANLVGANLTGVDLENADLTGANLNQADLRGAINITQAQISQANSSVGVMLPNYILPPSP